MTIENLDAKISRVSSRVTAVDQKIVQLDRKMKEVSDRLALFKPHAVETMFVRIAKSAKERGRRASEQIAFALLKETVITEVGFVVKEKYKGSALPVLTGIVKALDFSEEWWSARGDLEVKDWIRIFIDVANGKGVDRRNKVSLRAAETASECPDDERPDEEEEEGAGA